MIEMKNVTKKYPNGVVATNGISVNIKQGEFVYVVGPSGAGKSTFIKLMYREEKATSGEITVNGINLGDLKNKKVPFLRRQLGVVFQDFKLLPRLNVYENVAFALEVIEEEPVEIRRRVMEVLDLVGLKHKARMFPNELSGGEQQRVSIARSIVNVPKVVIADEPTGNLDSKTEQEIMNLMKQMNKENGTTFIIVTHEQEVAEQSDRVIYLQDGRVVQKRTRPA